MQTIQIFLHDGNTFTATVESYNADELATKMNDQRILMISIGNAIINKNVVKYITPVAAQ